ncbi:MAG: S8 family serine peptidase [Solirubrobacteraceae bacterium]|nr:S8 family serine peptidase [Solirubrobacteraceae bacterium]
MPRPHRWLACAVGCLVLGLAAAPAQSTGGGQRQDDRELAILLELATSPRLERFVRRVSDPRSPRYRRHLTVDRLVDRFGPSRTTKRRARRYAARHGLTARIHRSGVFATVTGPAAAVRAAFPPAAGARAATAGYQPTVPAELAPGVAGATTFDALPAVERQAPLDPAADQSAAARTGSPAGCPAGRFASTNGTTAGFTPNQYLSAYGHAALPARGITGRGVRMALIEIDGFDPADVAAFADCFGRTVPPIAVHPVGIPQPLPAGPETTLDLQVLAAAAPGLEAIDVYQGDSILMPIAAAVTSARRHPDVISMSLGGCENEQTAVGVRIVNSLLMLAAGSGTTTLVSSGDEGSSGCTNAEGAVLPVLAAEFPATSPYVTAVGGTNLELDADNAIVDEWVWNGSPRNTGAGSGGQSLLFARPWWQRAGTLNVTHPNRTVPDVAALADTGPGYAYYCTAPACVERLDPGGAGGWMTVGGTSAAAPLVAGGIALADEAAARRGQPPLGFASPLIYEIGRSKAAAQVIRDVTQGSNDVGTAIRPPLSNGRPLGCCDATPGYDLASGWGSLSIPRFSDAALGYGRRTARAPVRLRADARRP